MNYIRLIFQKLKKINHSQNKTLIVGTLLPTSICPYHFFLLSDRDTLIPAVRNTLRALFWLRICFVLVFEVCFALCRRGGSWPQNPSR